MATDVDAETNRNLEQKEKQQLLRQTRLLGRAPHYISEFFPNQNSSHSKLIKTTRVCCDKYSLWRLQSGDHEIECARIFDMNLLKCNGQKSEFPFARCRQVEVEASGSNISTIPKKFLNALPILQRFTLKCSKLKRLPSSLFAVPCLTHLDVQQNELRSLNGIENARGLTHFDVRRNKFHVLPSGVCSLFNLKSLNVSSNNLEELPSDIGKLHLLREFDCSANQIACLPLSLCSLVEITHLDVSYNQLTYLPEGIGNIYNLKDLKLTGNKLENLPSAVEQLRFLQSLFVGGNRFKVLPTSIAKLQSLRLLNASDNIIAEVPVAMPSLKILILDNNDMEDISETVLSCTNLEVLSIRENRISSIPDDISRLRKLRSLNVAENNILMIPPHIRDMDYLETLSINSIRIQCLPRELAEMDRLNYIDISHCDGLDPYLLLEFRYKGFQGVKEYIKKEVVYQKRASLIGDTTADDDDGENNDDNDDVNRENVYANDDEEDSQTNASNQKGINVTFADVHANNIEDEASDTVPNIEPVILRVKSKTANQKLPNGKVNSGRQSSVVSETFMLDELNSVIDEEVSNYESRFSENSSCDINNNDKQSTLTDDWSDDEKSQHETTNGNGNPGNVTTTERDRNHEFEHDEKENDVPDTPKSDGIVKNGVPNGVVKCNRPPVAKKPKEPWTT